MNPNAGFADAHGSLQGTISGEKPSNTLFGAHPEPKAAFDRSI